MKLSIVTTLYRSAVHIVEFIHRARSAASQLVGDDYEIVIVNDGSPDNSLDLATQCAETNTHITVVDLSRNFGHHRAMMIGLSYTKGDRVFLVDCDLEEEPEWMIPFAEQMALEKCDVVYGVQESRRGTWFERLSGDMFYRILNFFSRMDLPRQVVTARLMTRRYVAALLLHREREIFIVGLWHITGFLQMPQTITKLVASESTYTLSRKMSLVVNAITSFSNAPLVWIFYLGVSMSLVAGGYVAFLLVSWGFFSRPVAGWTSVIASIWLVGGMVICFLGVLGIYLSRIFVEVKHRPYAIVRSVFCSKNARRGNTHSPEGDF